MNIFMNKMIQETMSLRVNSNTSFSYFFMLFFSLNRDHLYNEFDLLVDWVECNSFVLFFLIIETLISVSLAIFTKS
ncbi:uncharacterized protein BX663DRAFT_491550 [Cokeromyces recurvatus]|uniref:uncharacterized protein n=1 Tax=Cokeromyces recurvatus TaxID=90255 RepID=UPI00222101ED|nr:uncharacterized protein BX663DRAFT_491550 [Cokeromyces recurvatus]KAI7907642.1 hypothetical protein BX663DRAFT_491550 [Cokeromyces recurvatus]